MRELELFRDPHFLGNLGVHGPRHEDGQWAVYPGVQPREDGGYDWDLGQWGAYKHPLTKDTPRTDLPGGGYTYENESFTVTVHPDSGEYDLRMELRSSAEYEGHVRVCGEDWPHLLVGQGVRHEDQPALDCLAELRFKTKLRIEYFKNCMKPENYDTERHGTQVHQFLTLVDLKNSDFIWFGIPYFDCRQARYEGFMGIDGGKADASGKLIYTTKQCHYTDASALDCEWLEYDVDLMPLIREAFDIAKREGLLRRSRFEDLRVTSTNIGFEMFGEFDAAVLIKDMSLTAVVKGEDYFADPRAAFGFTVHGPHHEDGYWAEYPGFNGRKADRRWELCQWGTYKHPLDSASARTDLPGGGYQYDTDSCTVTVLPEDADYDWRLELRTTHEYEGYIRKDGEDWPHLLAQQGFPWYNMPSLGQLESLRYHCRFRLAYCDNHMDMSKFVPEEHFAQTHHYFTVNDVTAGDYFWFGIPYFDTRHALFPGYLNIDIGKADATGKMIRTVPQLQLTQKSVLDGEWVEYDFDMLPLLREAYDTAKAAGVLQGCEFDRMVVTGTNIGFEMFAEFDAAIEVSEMRLTGYLK